MFLRLGYPLTSRENGRPSSLGIFQVRASKGDQPIFLNRFEGKEMSELEDLAKVFDGDDVSWIHDGFKTEKELVERGDRYMEFLFSPFPDLKLPRGFRALEIGSGLGYIMEALERYAQIQGVPAERIIGLDIAANMLEKAKARISSRPFDFLHYDGVHVPFEDGSLDFVYSVASLQHIPKPFVYNLFFEIKGVQPLAPDWL